jgi:hypothetical protein
MSSKLFIDNASKLVGDALHSLTLTNPAVALDVVNNIVHTRPNTSA